MARITYYKNSFLASLVSITGSIVSMAGVVALVEGEFLAGLLCAGVGIALMVLASSISEKKAFKQWWKQIENHGLVPEIRASRDVAVSIYQKNPRKETLRKIRALNSEAADYIENGFKEPVSGRQAAPVKTAPAQPVYQPPVQKTAPVQRSPQPVAQQSAPIQKTVPVQQAVPVQPQQPVRPAVNVRQVESDVVNRINREAKNAEPHRREQLYYDGILQLYGIYTNTRDAHLAETIAKLNDEYQWSSCDYTYKYYRMRFEVVHKAVALQDAHNLPAVSRRFYLIHNAIHGGICAGKSQNRSYIQGALEMLRIASGYRTELSRDTDLHYMQVSIPTIRSWLLYLLARSYVYEAPVDCRSAQTLLRESAHYLIKDPILMADMNPHLSWDKSQVLSLDMIRRLEQSIPQ